MKYKMLTIREISKTGILPEHAIRVLIKENKIKHIKVGNRTYINYYSVIEYINNVA